MSLVTDLAVIHRAVELIREIPSRTVDIRYMSSLSPGWADLLEAVAQGAADFSSADGADTMTEEMWRWSGAVQHAATVAGKVVDLLDPPAVDADAWSDGDTEAEPVDLDAVTGPSADGVVVPFRARR